MRHVDKACWAWSVQMCFLSCCYRHCAQLWCQAHTTGGDRAAAVHVSQMSDGSVVLGTEAVQLNDPFIWTTLRPLPFANAMSCPVHAWCTT